MNKYESQNNDFIIDFDLIINNINEYIVNVINKLLVDKDDFFLDYEPIYNFILVLSKIFELFIENINQRPMVFTRNQYNEKLKQYKNTINNVIDDINKKLYGRQFSFVFILNYITNIILEPQDDKKLFG